MRLGTPKIMVLFAWLITFSVFFSGYRFGGGNFTGIFVPYYESNFAVFWWLCTFLVSTATALALGLKNIFLALPGFLFPPFAIIMVAFLDQWANTGSLYTSLLFFLFFITCGPLLIRSYKDEKKRHKIYQGALLMMALLAVTFLFFSKSV